MLYSFQNWKYHSRRMKYRTFRRVDGCIVPQPAAFGDPLNSTDVRSYIKDCIERSVICEMTRARVLRTRILGCPIHV